MYMMTHNWYWYAGITIGEVREAVKRAKRGKSVGEDGVYVETLTGEPCIAFMHKMFDTCFTSAIIPAAWSLGIINLILKCASDDPRDPTKYRGITIASSVYTLYCSILNCRITSWVEENSILCDEQCGLRRERSTWTTSATYRMSLCCCMRMTLYYCLIASYASRLCMGTYCTQWGLSINASKSKIIHFRCSSQQLTNFNVVCKGSELEMVAQYKYLGLIFEDSNGRTTFTVFSKSNLNLGKKQPPPIFFVLCNTND